MDGSYSDDNIGSWLNFAQRPREQGGLGLQRHQAAGLVGNLQAESGRDLSPWGPTGDNGTAWGTAQWRNERLNGLHDFARANNMDPHSMQAQQAWMRQEFDTTHNQAYRDLLQARTPEEAAAVVNRKYEISADRSGRREQNARALFGQPSGPPQTALGFAEPDRPAAPAPSVFDGPGVTYAAGPTIASATSAPSAIPPLPAGVTPVASQSPSQSAAPAVPPLPPGVTPAAPQQPTAAAQPQEPNADFDTKRAVTQTATGFNEGFGSTVLRALDVAPYLVSKALGGEGVHPFEGTFREHFVDPMGQPQNRAEGVLRSGGHMAGANLPLLATGAGLANAGVRSGAALAEQASSVPKFLGGVADSTLDAIAARPVAAAAADTAGAFESGAGGKVARNVAADNGASPENQDRAEMFGQFGAPVGVAAWSKVSPTGLAIKGGKYVAGKALDNIPEAALPEGWRPGPGTYETRQADKLAFSNREGKYADPNVPAPPEGNFVTRRMDAAQAAREAQAGNAAGKELNQILDNPATQANQAEARRLEETIPGFQPGVAKSTQDPALLRLQETMEQRATGDELRRVQESHDANAQAIRNYQDQIIPPAGENPQDRVAAAVTTRVGQANRNVDRHVNATQEDIQFRSDNLPEVDRAAAGQTLRDIRHGEQGAADAEVQRLRGEIADPNQHVPELGMTVDQALNRRGEINNEVRDIASANARTPADVRRMRELGAERDTIDEALSNINDEGLRAYTRYYREQYAPRFLEGPSRDIGRYSSTGIDKNRVQAEDVPAKFYGPNNISEARQFNRLYGEGNAPESVAARRTMTDYALDDLRHTAVDPNTNMIREGAVNRWLQKNERLLNEMPWIRREVEARNPEELYQRLGDLEQRRRAIADTKVAGLVGKNPEQHIDAALNDWQTMRGLRASVRGDAEAEAALRRAVMDRAPDPMDAEKFGAWLDKHDRALRQVLDPSHIKALQDVLAAARIQGQLPRPTGRVDLPGSLADKGAKVFGITVPSLLQRALAVKQGRMSAEYGVADVAMRAARQFSNREIEDAWKEALYNPKVARDLEVMTRGATPIQVGRMRNYLMSVGLADASGNAHEKKDRVYVSPARPATRDQ